MTKILQIGTALSIMIGLAPSALADIAPPPVASTASIGVAGILIAAAMVLLGLWLIARMNRQRKEKQLIALGGSVEMTSVEKALQKK